MILTILLVFLSAFAGSVIMAMVLHIQARTTPDGNCQRNKAAVQSPESSVRSPRLGTQDSGLWTFQILNGGWLR